ncbi:MAG: outer membrane beta-barrel protein [Verrucomicrobiota bacterium]|nr:outer membrane beta-barrel protein [Verrucomicrobiota bacterium]
MKKIQHLIIAGCLFAFALPAMAQSEWPIHVFNRLRLGYDDNVYQSGGRSESRPGKKDSFRIVEEIEVLVNLNLERTYLGLRYRPSLIWYDERENDDTDFVSDLDVNFRYNFSPTLTLSLADTLRSNQLPELQDENYVVRENDDNYFNTAIATLSYNIFPETRIDFAGRYMVQWYDHDSPARKNNDYYSLVGGVSIRQQLASRSTLMADLRYQTVTYNRADEAMKRDADTIYAGLGVEQTFGPQLLGSLRGGMESRSYDNKRFDDNTRPYMEGSLTFLPTPATRLTASASYSIYESDVDAYMSQNRTHVSLSAAHDFTAKLNAYISAAYTLSSYDADYAIDSTLTDADEDAYYVSARLAYRLNRINWIEIDYQFVKLDSEVRNRESYDRNRVDIGWRIQLF